MTGIVMLQRCGPANDSAQSSSFYNDQLMQHSKRVATEDTMEMTAKGCALTESNAGNRNFRTVLCGAAAFSGCIEKVLELSPSFDQDEWCRQSSCSAG
ncbi:hypothetical protein NKH99_31805 [Mesorhizobium sp. M0854]|uniref:hypothetical protein n=1 Tax=Mesorhizobium sp. M0854 TaxID=2957013 RepID=UPI00333C6355